MATDGAECGASSPVAFVTSGAPTVGDAVGGDAAVAPILAALARDGRAYV